MDVKVGQAVIQIATSRGLNTVNFIRNRFVLTLLHFIPYNDTIYMYREDTDTLKTQLRELGANHVATYDELSEKSFRGTLKDWTGGKVRVSSHSFILLLIFP
jgi:trans-2-enoyl-CoA reductase